MELCGTCQGIFCQTCTFSIAVGHHKTISRFLEASEEGCYVCRRLLNDLSDDQREVLQQLSSATISNHESVTHIKFMNNPGLRSNPNTIVIMVSINQQHSQLESASAARGFEQSAQGWLGHKSAIVLELFHPSDFLGIRFRQPTSCTTKSEETWDFAVKWLQECQSHHLRCQKRKGNDKWHPTRLLDIGTERENLSTFQLAHRSQINPAEEYVTLSHRWGDADFLQLESENMETLVKGMAITILPQTFQDAITLARRISIRYVWIDSLCIIQKGDNGADWKREASCMHMVYTKSFCNISAAWTVTPSRGIFSIRDPSLLSPIELSLSFDSDPHSRERRILSDTKTVWLTEIREAPLNKRGWVLQERLLSPRILHFCRHELFWECCEVGASETYPDGLPQWSLDHNLKQFEPFSELCRDERERHRMSTDDKYLKHQVWWHIMQAYSVCKLTKQSDKLIAISGIARHMKRIIADQYIAGLWKTYLASEILWFRSVDSRYPRTDPRFNPSPKPILYDMPSFTWASINSELSIACPDDWGIQVEVECVYLRLSNGRTKIESPTTLPVLEDIYECTASQSLHLRVIGKLRSMRLAFHKSKERWEIYIRSSIGRTESASSTVMAEWSKVGVADLDFDLNVQETKDTENEIFYYMPWKYGPQWFHCVILEASCGNIGVFRRKGIFFTDSEEKIKELLEEQGNENLLPCYRYDKTSMAHTIFIC